MFTSQISKLVLTLLFLSTASALAADDGSKALYESKCAQCHGKAGDGTGRKGKDLDPKPTDFTDAKIYTDKKKLDMTPDERMEKSISKGGKEVGESNGMKAFPDLTPEQVKGLVEYIKTFKK